MCAECHGIFSHNVLAVRTAVHPKYALQRKMHNIINIILFNLQSIHIVIKQHVGYLKIAICLIYNRNKTYIDQDYG